MKLIGFPSGGPPLVRSGPSPLEQTQIRALVAEGATVDDLKERFPDVDPHSLEAWHRSLQPKPEPAGRPSGQRRGARS